MSMGKAFEWAVGLSLSQKTGAGIVKNPPAIAAQDVYNAMPAQKRQELLNAANIAMDNILSKEAAFVQTATRARPAVVVFNTQAAGQRRDVRDVLLQIGGKEIGISCKHNPQALKHLRLTAKFDFIKVSKLDARGCSAAYWNAIKPLFNRLQQIQQSSGDTARWSDVINKDTVYYSPILNVLAGEIERVCGQSNPKSAQKCRAMITYLVGSRDFYKVIYEPSPAKVHIQGFNFNSTLNSARTRYPNCLNSISDENGEQYSKTVEFNRGYSINFRIHSTRTMVEPLFKLDINAIGLPAAGIYQQTLVV